LRGDLQKSRSIRAANKTRDFSASPSVLIRAIRGLKNKSFRSQYEVYRRDEGKNLKSNPVFSLERSCEWRVMGKGAQDKSEMSCLKFGEWHALVIRKLLS
jgi:hypothetical protein